MIKCFFHSADLDGHCSGAIVKYKYPETELIGINYGQQFHWNEVDTKKDTIFMVDFGLQPFNEMAKLYTKFEDRLIWIDHHISAINEAEAWKDDIEPDQTSLNLRIPGIRQNGTAACILTWKYLFPDTELPKAIELLGRYDVWDINEEIMQFQYGFKANEDTWPDNQDLWKPFFENQSSLITSTINTGKIILDYQRKQDEIYCKTCAFEIKFEGYRALAVNKRLTSSTLFDSIWSNKRYDIMITFGIKRNGLWDTSFYSDKPNVDVSQIAKKYGGGGHKGAAGCQFKILPKEFINKFKELQRLSNKRN